MFSLFLDTAAIWCLRRYVTGEIGKIGKTMPGTMAKGAEEGK